MTPRNNFLASGELPVREEFVWATRLAVALEDPDNQSLFVPFKAFVEAMDADDLNEAEEFILINLTVFIDRVENP